jgi:hypothetical protein
LQKPDSDKISTTDQFIVFTCKFAGSAAALPRQKTNNRSFGAAKPLIFTRLAALNIARIQKSA